MQRLTCLQVRCRGAVALLCGDEIQADLFSAAWAFSGERHLLVPATGLVHVACLVGARLSSAGRTKRGQRIASYVALYRAVLRRWRISDERSLRMGYTIQRYVMPGGGRRAARDGWRRTDHVPGAEKAALVLCEQGVLGMNWLVSDCLLRSSCISVRGWWRFGLWNGAGVTFGAT